VALVESDFISIGEHEDLFVGSPVLDAGPGSSSSLHLVLSQEVFVLESIEVRTFSFIWELWRVADHIAVGSVPSCVEVLVTGTFLGIKNVDKGVVLNAQIKIGESFHIGNFVLEASVHDESLVVEGVTVAKLNLVGFRVDLCGHKTGSKK